MNLEIYGKVVGGDGLVKITELSWSKHAGLDWREKKLRKNCVGCPRFVMHRSAEIIDHIRLLQGRRQPHKVWPENPVGLCIGDYDHQRVLVPVPAGERPGICTLPRKFEVARSFLRAVSVGFKERDFTAPLPAAKADNPSEDIFSQSAPDSPLQLRLF